MTITSIITAILIGIVVGAVAVGVRFCRCRGYAGGTRRDAAIRFHTNSTTMAPRVAARMNSLGPADWLR